MLDGLDLVRLKLLQNKRSEIDSRRGWYMTGHKLIIGVSIYGTLGIWCVISFTGKVTVGLVESNGNLPPGLWLMSPAELTAKKPESYPCPAHYFT